MKRLFPIFIFCLIVTPWTSPAAVWAAEDEQTADTNAAVNSEHHRGPVLEALEGTEKILEHPVEESAHAATSSGHHGERDYMTLAAWEMVWTIVVFLLFFAVLSFLVWPKVLDALRERENKQRDDLTEAQNASAEAKATLAQYKAQLAEAQKEAQRIIEESRKDAEKVAAKVKADTEHDIQNMKQRAQADIETAKNQAVKEVFDRAADLSVNIAGQILKREINTEDHKQLVQSSLDQLERN